jgi:hypothetical protein
MPRPYGNAERDFGGRAGVGEFCENVNDSGSRNANVLEP